MRDARPAAVYRLHDSQGALLYVGASVDPSGRSRSHRWMQTWGKEIDKSRTTITWYPDVPTAADAERAAIQDEAPKYNLRGAGGVGYSGYRGWRRPRRLGNEPIGPVRTELEALARDWRIKIAAREEARETLIGAIRWAALDGMSQSEIARRTGMTRVTVGKALRP